MARKTKSSILALLEELSSTRRSTSRIAHAALVELGAPIVDKLVDKLDEDRPELQLRLISVLAEIGSPAAGNALIGLLHAPCERVRERASWALGRVPASRAPTALEKLLARETESKVRLSATRSLVRLVMTGRELAFRPLLQILLDEQESAHLRTTAMSAIPYVISQTARATRVLLNRLADDSQASVSNKASRMIDSPPKARLEPWAVAELLKLLARPRRSHWKNAEDLLVRGGAGVVAPLVESMVEHAENRAFCQRCARVLAAMPAHHQNRIGPYLETVTEPIPLEALIEVVEQGESRALLARLASLIERIARLEESGPGPLHNVRRRAHTALSLAGSRLACRDLRQQMNDRRFPASVELARAAGRIGTHQELASLLDAYLRSKGLARIALCEATREIVHRERIRRSHSALTALEAPQRRAIKEILGTRRSQLKPHRVRRSPTQTRSL